jgi:hypothetical protein
MNSFTRDGTPMEKLGLGGFYFNTLKPGAILKTKRFFGVSISTGIISGYTSSAIKFSKDTYILVIDIRDGIKPGTKNISWAKFQKLEWAHEQKEKLREGGKKAVSWYGTTKGFFHDLTKRRFDYRLEVIDPGFNESKTGV